MRPTNAALAALAAMIVSAAPAATQAADEFPWDSFKPGDLAALMADLEAMKPHLPGLNRIFVSDAPHVVVKAKFAGQSRPVTPLETELIVMFGKAQQQDTTAFAAEFKQAYAFDDGGRRYWLLVEEQVAQFFAKELRPGAPVRLYLVELGGIAAPGEPLAPVFVVEAYGT